MKLTKLKMAVLGALLVPTMSVIAEEAATAASEAPKSDFSFSANVGIYSDYIFRGYTQTQNNPALQGGMDVEHSSGFYAGTWASNVEWTTQGTMNENSLEVDVYGGYALELAGVGVDVGVLQYLYPGDQSNTVADANATELYVAISKSFGPVGVALKNSTVVSDEAWGFYDMQGENYTELNVDFPVGPLALSVHVGHQTFGTAPGSTIDYDYTDWKLNAEYPLNDAFAIGAFYTDTNMKDADWTFGTVKVGDSVGGVYLAAGF